MSSMATVDPKIWLALGTAVLSLVGTVIGAIWNWRNQRGLARLNADLSERSAAKNAKLEYEFEARKRLYQECGPLLFQLSEYSERALGRIIGLARSAADGDLDAGRSWLGRRYYSLSTYYRLIAPLSLGKLLKRRLTHLDLSLDSKIHWQYTLIKQLEDSFTDDFDFTGGAVDPALTRQRLEYDPHNEAAEKLRSENPAVYWQQGIPRGIMDNAAFALIAKDPDGTERVMDFHEFQEVRFPDNGSSVVCETFDRIAYLFEEFHPRTRPVLWRILIAQAHLYQAIIVSQQSTDLAHDFWSDIWGEGEPPDFDWRKEDEKQKISGDNISAAVKVGEDYAFRTTSSILAKRTPT